MWTPNSRFSGKPFNFNLIDLKSRLNSFVNIGIDIPTDDLLKVIITKSFSDKQIKVNVKILINLQNESKYKIHLD